MKKSRIAATSLIFAFVFAIPAIFVPIWARAFDSNAGKNIKFRQSPYYQSPGGRLGAFIVRPSLELIQVYDSNIFRQSKAKDDFITTVKPELRVRSDWNLHSIEAGVLVNSGFFSDYNSENYHDYTFFASGKYDLDYDTYFNLDVRYDKRHQDRGAVDDAGGDNPTEYSVKSVFLGFTRELNILRLNVSADQRIFAYDNSSVGGVTIDNGDRNYAQRILGVRVAYGLGSDYEAFIKGTYDNRKYKRKSASFRDSKSYNLRAGMAVNITGKLHGDIYAGYMRQKFDGNFKPVGSMDFGGSVLWNMTDIISVEAAVERTLIETVQTNSSSVIRTKANLGIDHALRENVLLGASAAYTQDSYQGDSSAGNNNNIYEAGMSVIYNPYQNISTKFNYDYLNRKFDDSSRNYNNSKLSLSLKYSY